MNEAIERLRQSKAKYLAGLTETVGSEGRNWAMLFASYWELQALRAIDFDDAPANDDGERGVLARWVAEQLTTNEEEIFGDELPCDDYAKAFFIGAVDYFTEIQNEL